MEIDALILAAGKSERLGALTHEIPKCLLEIASDTTLLDAQIRALVASGYIRHILIAAGYRAEKVRAHVATRYANTSVDVLEIPGFAELNNAHTLREALLHHTDRNILEVNGDVYCDPRVFTEAAATLSSCPPAEARVFVRRAVCGEEEMKVQMREDGTIERLLKQIDPVSAIGEAFGITYLGRDFARTLPASLQRVIDRSAQSYFEDGLNEHFAEGNHAYPRIIGKRLAVEVDFPEDLALARRLYASVNNTG